MNEKKLTKEDVQFINETARQISYVLNCGGAITMSWGIQTRETILYKGMAALKCFVNGFLFTGNVIVAYNEGSDLYDAFFVNCRNETVKVIRDIYFDELVNVLDKQIETNNDKSAKYEQQVKKFYNL